LRDAGSDGDARLDASQERARVYHNPITLFWTR
jgi:hypothetical protein